MINDAFWVSFSSSSIFVIRVMLILPASGVIVRPVN